MAIAPKRPDDELPRGMNVDAFLAWAETRRGRYELHGGAVVAVAPKRLGHAKTKFAIHRALYAAIKRAGLDCHLVPDGVAVHVTDMK